MNSVHGGGGAPDFALIWGGAPDFALILGGFLQISGGCLFLGGSSKFFGGGFSPGIQSTFGRYASYWNAFLFSCVFMSPLK